MNMNPRITHALAGYIESIACAIDHDTIARMIDEACGYCRGVYDCEQMTLAEKSEWWARIEQAGEDRSRELEEDE